ncbi:transposon Ty3-I Gag-Pol polyprotein [Trichonephila clavipes]|nr:transposon Ty3-I Gag-Pol polyprotein [Trichonephila clavipes]
MYSLCARANPSLSEDEKVAHLMKGIAEDFYQTLLVQNIGTVDEFTKWSHHIEKCNKNKEHESSPDIASIIQEIMEAMASLSTSKQCNTVLRHTASQRSVTVRLLPSSEETGLTLNSNKCSFGKKKLMILGHLVDQHGMYLDPQKTTSITNFPVPQNVAEVQSLCSYYQRFIKNFADIAKS